MPHDIQQQPYFYDSLLHVRMPHDIQRQTRMPRDIQRQPEYVRGIMAGILQRYFKT